MAEIGEAKVEQTWEDTQRRRIKKIFDLYDKDKKGCIPREEVGTVLRAVGIYPSERTWVRDILDDIMGDEPTAWVVYDRLESKALELLKARTYDADTDDTLMQAFKVLDTENRGYLTVKQMRDVLSNYGTNPFQDHETDAFMSVAKDMETGNIFYEDYVNLLVAALEVSDKDF